MPRRPAVPASSSSPPAVGTTPRRTARPAPPAPPALVAAPRSPAVVSASPAHRLAPLHVAVSSQTHARPPPPLPNAACRRAAERGLRSALQGRGSSSFPHLARADRSGNATPERLHRLAVTQQDARPRVQRPPRTVGRARTVMSTLTVCVPSPCRHRTSCARHAARASHRGRPRRTCPVSAPDGSGSSFMSHCLALTSPDGSRTDRAMTRSRRLAGRPGVRVDA